MKNKQLYTGFLFVLVAIFIICYQLNLIHLGIGLWTAMLTIILVIILIKGLRKLNIPVIAFSLAFLGILYAEQLHIQKLVPWPIIFVALFLSIGLSLIFKRSYGYNIEEHTGFNWHQKNHHYADNRSNVDENNLDIDVKVGSAIRYVRANNFTHGNLKVTAGDVKLYFDETYIDKQADLQITGFASHIQIYIPRTWRIDNQLNNIVSEIHETGRSSEITAATLRLNGVVSASSMHIHYL